MSKLFSVSNIALAAGALLVCVLVVAGVKADRLARIGAGYKAKITCSELFVAKRDAETVTAGEFNDIDPTLDLITTKINQEEKTVLASAFGLGRAQAIYREGYGCTLANGGRIAPLAPRIPADAADPWPTARPISSEALPWVDYGALHAVLNNAFDDPAAGHRAIVIAVDGKIVDEWYADGFDKDTPFLSWSMAKSIIATLIGVAELKGVVNIDAPPPIPEWSENDTRTAISWRDLLQMQSGLAFAEEYASARSDVNQMLFERADSGQFAARSPAAAAPGDVWQYSSGTSNILSRALAEALRTRNASIFDFADANLFYPIGASSTIMEPDAAGTPIASSFIYATARDWTRLGQLYLQDGVWGDERLLPEGWADFVASPAAASDNQYGAHFWLNRDGEDGRARFVPGLPETMYFMSGHDGQYVFIIPSKRMVVVRTGLNRTTPALDYVAPLMGEIYTAVGVAPGYDR